MRAVLIAVLALALSSPVDASPPTVVVTVTINDQPYKLPDPSDRELKPIQAVAGDDIVFDLSSSEGEPDRFYTIVEERKPGESPLTISNNGKTVRLRSHAGLKRLRFLVSNVDGFNEWRQPVLVLCREPELPDPPTPPTPTPPKPPTPTPPTPVPTPVPDPVIPNGEFGVSAKVAEIVKRIADPNKAATAKTLADAADAIAAQIAAGTMTGVNDLLVKIGEAIKATNNPQWQAAATEFSGLLSATYTQHKGGKLAVSTLGGFKNPTEWATLMREMAVGVRAGAK